MTGKHSFGRTYSLEDFHHFITAHSSLRCAHAPGDCLNVRAAISHCYV
jgi:hypothetical protein